MKDMIIQQHKKNSKYASNEEHHNEEGEEQTSLKEMYQNKFKIMIKEVFRQKNDPKDIKQMYDKIKLII